MKSRQVIKADTPVVDDVAGQSQTADGPPDSSRTDATSPTTPAVPDETDRLPKDVIFDLLSNERRRRVLVYMDDNGLEATLSDLAEHIASIENDKPVTALTSSERKRVYICLYQCHLPKLDDANAIDYNKPRGTVELEAAAHQLLTYLPGRAEPNQTDSWLQRLVPAPLLALAVRYVEWKPVAPLRHR